jgi:hypothetical protein
MKTVLPVSLLTLILLLSGCEVIGGIFKAGVWVGVLAVVAVVAVIIYLFSRTSKK